VASIRERIPGVALSTDVIVGFPGETDAHFEETLSLTREVRFSRHVLVQVLAAPRTLAGQRYPDDVSEPEKSRRIVALQQLQRTIQSEIFEEMVGKAYDVLIDGPSRRRPDEWAGRTDGNTIVNVALAGAVTTPWRRAGVHHPGQGHRGRPQRGQRNAMLIEMAIKGLMIDQVTSTPIIVLRDKDATPRARNLGRRLRGKRRSPCRSRTRRRPGR
jgi:hypothetical protein